MQAPVPVCSGRHPPAASRCISSVAGAAGSGSQEQAGSGRQRQAAARSRQAASSRQTAAGRGSRRQAARRLRQAALASSVQAVASSGRQRRAAAVLFFWRPRKHQRPCDCGSPCAPRETPVRADAKAARGWLGASGLAWRLVRGVGLAPRARRVGFEPRANACAAPA